MIVIATGPRSNGTSLLYRIIATGGGKTPLHLPAYPPEFRDQDWVGDFPTALFVVIERGIYYAARSAVTRGFHRYLVEAVAEQEAARLWLHRQARAMPQRVLFVDYRGLVRQPEISVSGIEAWLRDWGYAGGPLSIPEAIVDGDVKYREREQVA